MQPAALIDDYAKLFAPMRRNRGLQLFAMHAVAIDDTSPTEVGGIVTDSAQKRPVHQVHLQFTDGILDVSCDCRGPAYCEHGYALLLAQHALLTREKTGRKKSPPPAAARVAEPRPAAAPPPPAEWRQRLGAVAERADTAEPPRKQRLPIYMIDLAATRRAGRLRVHAMLPTTTKGKDGTFELRSITSSTSISTLPAADQNLLKVLRTSTGALAWDDWDGDFDVDAEWSGTVVPLLFQTGRVSHVDSVTSGRPAESLAFDPGEPFAFRTTMERTPQALRIHGVFQRGDEVLSCHEVNAVVDGGFLLLGNRMVRARLGRTPSFARSLLQDGPLVAEPRDERAMLGSVLALTQGDPDVAPPVPTRVAPAPAPVFLVHMGKSTGKHVHCELQFAYGEIRVGCEDPAVLPEPDGDTWLMRDDVVERAQEEQLLAAAGDALEPTAMDGCFVVARKHLTHMLTDLVDAGIRVLADGKPFLRYESFKVSVKTGIDWFDVEGALDFGPGASLPLAKALLAAKRGERFVELGDGRTGVMPEEWLQRWAAVLDLGEVDGERVRLRSSQALLLDALLSAREPAEITTDKGYRALQKRLAEFAGVAPRQEPQGFQGELRPYQRQGLGWLHFLRDLGLGGCLADDMGLGKTVQVLALLQHVHEDPRRRPSLLVVPRSLLDNWQREAARFTPKLRVALFTGSNRWERLGPARLAELDVIVTTYGTLRADAARFEQEQITFEYAILDEAQAVGNDASLSSKAVRLLRANHRLALTGTPVQNHLGELWALFEFLSPGLLGRSSVFQALIGAGRKGGARLDAKLLHKALAPFLLRRTKEQVLPDLPEKQEQLLVCDLEGTQRAAYDALREHYREALRNGGGELDNRERFMALEALLRLRQAACHEGLLDGKFADRASAKLDALLPMLQEIVASGHKALVFSQFVGFLTIVRERLDALGVTYEYLDGSTRDRQRRVDRFQEDAQCPVFLISLKAGGFGLNLTAADYVFVLDPWWNPAAEAQAIDRAHRLGQVRKVAAYRLVARDTVEEKVLRLQAEKRALVEAVLGSDGGLLRGMTREDLLGLIG